MKQILRLILPPLLILGVGALIFMNNLADFYHFLIWWFCLAAMGILFLPITRLAFGRFRNGGYMFSKALCLAAAGYLQWLLTSLRILPFRVWACFLVMLVLLLVNIIANRKTEAWQSYVRDREHFKSAVGLETLFLGLLLFWTFLRALRPELEGLEKFMDFGFVNSILRSDWLPAPDMWLAGNGINYYYLGQFFTAFLTRLTFIDAAVTYNLMMATLFALAFMLAYSIAEMLIEVYQQGRPVRKVKPSRKHAGAVAGVTAGLSVCLAGNLHALFYAVLFPHLNDRDSYWFPAATRFIGYNPDVAGDKTIHEFPVYSFVVSDLHAHVINILFVLTVIGLLVALVVKLLERHGRLSDAAAVIAQQEGDSPVVSKKGKKNRPGNTDPTPESLDPEPGNRGPFPYFPFFMIVFLIGLFPAMNFWDFPIYIVFSGALLLYSNLRSYDFSRKSLLVTVVQTAFIGIAAYIVTLPFSLSFDTMGAEIRFVEQRSLLYQLGVLWGWQLLFAAALTFIMIKQYRYVKQARSLSAKQEDGTSAPPRKGKKAPPRNIVPPRLIDRSPLFRFIDGVNPADAIVFVTFICATGLFIIPEIIYISDIYPAHPRANTMFKLGYQAFIMFGIGAGYTFARLIYESKRLLKAKTFLTIAAYFFLISALIYPWLAIGQWYGNLITASNKGLDGTAYMLTSQKSYTGADDESVHISIEDDHALIV